MKKEKERRQVGGRKRKRQGKWKMHVHTCPQADPLTCSQEYAAGLMVIMSTGRCPIRW